MQKDDVIYRQDAIDVLDVGKELLSCALDNMDIVGNDREKFEWGLGLIESYIDDIKDIPSAQPETHDKRTETHACDLINRQQAIDAVVSAMIDGADAELVEGVMELLPSAQPEPCEDAETEEKAEVDDDERSD